MSRFELRSRKQREDRAFLPYIEPVPPSSKRRIKNREKISVADKISIAYRVIVEHEMQATVAKEFRTSIATVSYIVKKVLSSPTAIEEMQQKRDEPLQKRAAIRRVVKGMLVREDFIDSAAAVKKAVLD